MALASSIPDKLVITLRNCQRLCILTGSGISAESGIPTFREAQTGLWAQYDPLELATPSAFQKNPGLVWEWYAWRRGLVTAAEPNPGHLALVTFERKIPDFTLITQNVDGLHQRAGHRQVIELHGNILRTRCSIDGQVVDEWPVKGDNPPHCPHCGGLLRPDVVWFGETLPPQALQQAIQAAEVCQVFISIGTSAVVEPAASLPFIALRSGADVVEVNPQPTQLTAYAAYVLSGPAGEVLPDLIQQVWGDV
jgi:NAD-dependent deacetylase